MKKAFSSLADEVTSARMSLGGGAESELIPAEAANIHILYSSRQQQPQWILSRNLTLPVGHSNTTIGASRSACSVGETTIMEPGLILLMAPSMVPACPALFQWRSPCSRHDKFHHPAVINLHKPALAAVHSTAARGALPKAQGHAHNVNKRPQSSEYRPVPMRATPTRSILRSYYGALL